QNDYRVKVNLPMVAAGTEGVWARLATLDAGNKRGTFFYPEVDDEVILGFMNDDPREPVILGMLHSKNSSGKPPIEPTQNNFVKGIYTKGEIKLVFDDEKKSVTIETPGGNKVLITDKDEAKITISDSNQNKIEMTKDGINITSGKDLNLKATGDIKIEGVNITTSANAQYKAEGNSGVELSSSANAVIKGAVVQIN
ncbi:MAG: phage baseplate assembly protein V, partial [Bacteroidia bacterium]